MEADFEVINDAAAFVLSSGGDAIVVSPSELRAEVRKRAACVAQVHRDTNAIT